VPVRFTEAPTGSGVRSDVGDGAGFVVGQAVHHQRRAADAVAFVAQFDVFHAFQIARTFVDGALHVVFGHIVFGGFFQSQAQARVRAGIAAACALAMILAALWPGLPERVTLLPDTVPGQTAVRRRDLASLVRTQVEQIGGVHSATVTTRRSRVDVVVLSVLDDLEPVQEAARKTTDEALETLQPEGITRSRVRIKRTS